MRKRSCIFYFDIGLTACTERVVLQAVLQRVNVLKQSQIITKGLVSMAIKCK